MVHVGGDGGLDQGGSSGIRKKEETQEQLTQKLIDTDKCIECGVEGRQESRAIPKFLP